MNKSVIDVKKKKNITQKQSEEVFLKRGCFSSANISCIQFTGLFFFYLVSDSPELLMR